MAKKFYVVWQGRQTGVFTDWDTCKSQIDKFAGAKYKSFKTRPEAEAAFRGGSQAAQKVSKAAPKKKSSSRGPKTYTSQEVDDHAATTKIFLSLYHLDFGRRNVLFNDDLSIKYCKTAIL